MLTTAQYLDVSSKNVLVWFLIDVFFTQYYVTTTDSLYQRDPLIIMKIWLACNLFIKSFELLVSVCMACSTPRPDKEDKHRNEEQLVYKIYILFTYTMIFIGMVSYVTCIMFSIYLYGFMYIMESLFFWVFVAYMLTVDVTDISILMSSYGVQKTNVNTYSDDTTDSDKEVDQHQSVTTSDVGQTDITSDEEPSEIETNNLSAPIIGGCVVPPESLRRRIDFSQLYVDEEPEQYLNE